MRVLSLVAMAATVHYRGRRMATRSDWPYAECTGTLLPSGLVEQLLVIPVAFYEDGRQERITP